VRPPQTQTPTRAVPDALASTSDRYSNRRVQSSCPKDRGQQSRFHQGLCPRSHHYTDVPVYRLIGYSSHLDHWVTPGITGEVAGIQAKRNPGMAVIAKPPVTAAVRNEHTRPQRWTSEADLSGVVVRRPKWEAVQRESHGGWPNLRDTCR